MSGYFDDAQPRALRPADILATRQVVLGALGLTPYYDRALMALERAERGGDPEYRALVIERDGTVAALALFGTPPGAGGSARLHFLAAPPEVAHGEVPHRLIGAVIDEVRAQGGTTVVAGLPDDPAIGPITALLRRAGFEEVARLPDYYREGIALVYLRRQA